MTCKDIENTLFPVQYGRATLKPYEKLRLGSEFAYVRENGVKYTGKYMLLVAAQTPDNKVRFGIICGKKYSNKAVVRNRARRLLKESFRLLKTQVLPCHIILIARKLLMSQSLRDVQMEMVRLLKKAKLWIETE